jgi:DNA-binding transcriptional ArsR family regulator
MLPVSRPAVSQHLPALEDAGLVTDTKAGTRRMYQFDSGGCGRVACSLRSSLGEGAGSVPEFCRVDDGVTNTIGAWIIEERREAWQR